MNKTQKKVLVGAALAMVLMVMFPPFELVGPTGATRNMGYGFVGDPPNFSYTNGTVRPGTVNTKMLLLEFLVAGVAAIIGFAVTKE